MLGTHKDSLFLSIVVFTSNLHPSSPISLWRRHCHFLILDARIKWQGSWGNWALSTREIIMHNLVTHSVMNGKQKARSGRKAVVGNDWLGTSATMFPYCSLIFEEPSRTQRHFRGFSWRHHVWSTPVFRSCSCERQRCSKLVIPQFPPV